MGLPEAVITAISGSWSVTGLDDTAFALLHHSERASAPALRADQTVIKKPTAPDVSRTPQFENLRRVVRAAKTGASTALVAELNAILAHSGVIDTTKLLAEWLREVLYVGGVKVATAKTYLSRIGPRLFAEFGETELVGIGAEDFVEAYRSCIAATRSRENAILVSQLLAQFHAFAVRRFGLPELDEGISQLSGLRMVRATTSACATPRGGAKLARNQIAHPVEPCRHLCDAACLALWIAAGRGLRVATGRL